MEEYQETDFLNEDATDNNDKGKKIGAKCPIFVVFLECQLIAFKDLWVQQRNDFWLNFDNIFMMTLHSVLWL